MDYNNPMEMVYYSDSKYLNNPKKIKGKKTENDKKIEQQKSKIKDLSSESSVSMRSIRNEKNKDLLILKNNPIIKKESISSTSLISKQKTQEKEFLKLIKTFRNTQEPEKKIDILAELTEKTINRLPSIVEKLSHGEKDLSTMAFDESLQLLKTNRTLEPFVQATELFLSLALQEQVGKEKQRHEFALSKMENGREKEQYRHAINNLSHSGFKFCEVDINSFEPTVFEFFKKTSGKLLGHSSLEGSMIDVTVNSLQNWIYGPIKAGLFSFSALESQKKMTALKQISKILELRKKELEISKSGGLQKVELLKIKEQEKEIEQFLEEIDKQAFEGTIQSINYGLQATEGVLRILDEVKKLIPEGHKLQIFETIAEVLKLGTRGVMLCLPGASLWNRVVLVNDFLQEFNALGEECEKLQKEISQLDGLSISGSEELLDAKKALWVILFTKREIIESSLMPRQIWMMLEDFTFMGGEIRNIARYSEKFSLGVLSSLGINGVSFAGLSSVGVGLSIANSALSFGRILLTDRGVIRKWIAEFQLHGSLPPIGWKGESKALKKEIEQFHLWTKELSERVFPLDTTGPFSFDQVELWLEEGGKMITEQIDLCHQQLQSRELKDFRPILDRIDRWNKARRALISIGVSTFNKFLEKAKIEEKNNMDDIKLGYNEILAFKQQLLESVALPEMMIFEHERSCIEEKSKNIEESYLKERKYAQHLWKGEDYYQFSDDLRLALQKDKTRTEIGKYIESKDSLLYEKIFLDGKDPNIQLLMDFIFPDI